MKEMLGRFRRTNFPLNQWIVAIRIILHTAEQRKNRGDFGIPAHHGRTPKDFSLEFVLNRQATGPCPNVASVFREGVGGVGFFNGWFTGCSTLICPMTS